MFTLADVYAAAGQDPPTGAAGVRIDAAHYDSRRIEPGMLFVALPGAKVDGNDYVAAAFEAGAAAALCARGSESLPGDRQVVSPHTLESFQRLADRLRSRSSATFVGLTGSNGKTTTKQALAAALGAAGPTLATDRSENTDIGIPATLSRLRPEHRYAVLEMGAQTTGEIAAYCRFARPDAAVITNIGAAHLGLFGSRDAVAQAKAELLAGLPPGAPAILCADDARTAWLTERAPGPVTTFGRGDEADVRVRGTLLRQPAGTLVELRTRGREFAVEVAGVAGPIDLAFGAAMAAAMALDVEPEVAATGLLSFEPPPHRMRVLELSGGRRLLDDTYNANLGSVRAALQTLRRMPGAKRRVAVLGDMFELGDFAADQHRAAGRAAADVDHLICVGVLARHLREGAIAAGLPERQSQLIAAETESDESILAACREVAELLLGTLQSGDVVLLKASNGMRFARIVEALSNAWERP